MNKLFEYEAFVSNGEKIHGTFNGTEDEFKKMIASKKLIVVKIKEKTKKLDRSKFNHDDFLSFIEELYYLTNSGMSIDQSLKMLINTATKESQIRIFKDTLHNLKSGEQLSIALKKALLKERYALDELSISFISTSEEVGSLSNGLHQLFEYLSFQKKIKSDIKQALAYPMFLMIMSFIVAFLIFFLIIPRFSTIFSPEEFEKLPALSHTVLSMGLFLSENMEVFLFGFLTILIILVIVLKKFSIPWLSILYKIPKVSNIIIDLQLTITYNTLGTMISGGLQLDNALKQMKNIKLLPELNDLITNTLFELKRGQKLSGVFSLSKIIPPSDIALLTVGENSASLDKIFSSLSKRHSESFSNNVKKFLSLLEPAVIVGLGVFIATIVISIMMAVMSMTDIAG